MTKEERLQKLNTRLVEMKAFDSKYIESKDFYLAGVDEVGRGPLAGPVVTACVVLPPDFDILGVDDSKKVSEKKREELYSLILEKAVAYGIGIKDSKVIDEVNILEATKLAMKESITKCQEMLEKNTGNKLSFVLIDAVKLDIDIPQGNIIKGDANSLSIAAASIIAKVTRDRMMIEYAKAYPYYGFESNKGYGTKAHYEGIKEHGITDIHRYSFLKSIGY